MSYPGNFLRKRKKLRELNIQKYGKLTCEYCGKKDLKLGYNDNQGPDISTVDHFIPIKLGGNHSWENLYICCRECNETKGCLHPLEFREEYYNKKLNNLIKSL